MAYFPTTTEELDEYINDYITAHIAERIEAVTVAQIASAVNSYMQNYGAAIEDNGEYGDVPLIEDNELDADNTAIPIASLSNGVPISFLQARVRAIALAAAHLITHADIAMPIVTHTSSDTDVSISPNVLHVWSGSIESLDVTFTGSVSGQVNEYMLQFVVDGDEFELTLPDGVRWIEEPEFEDGNTYQVSIVNGLAISGAWEAEESS